MLNSPWGMVQELKHLYPGITSVSTASHGGIMVEVAVAEKLLSPAAQECGFDEGGYLCFEEDCQAAVVMRELIDKKLIDVPGADKVAYEKALNQSIKRYNPDYWQSRLVRLKPQKQLFDRLDENFSDFKKGIMSCDKNTIFIIANKISAVVDVYEYLKQGCDADVANFLLNFQNPLEVVSDNWLLQRQDKSDMDFVIRNICDKQDALSDYPLAPVEKKSVLSTLQEKAKDIKPPTASTDKSHNNEQR